MRNYEKLRKHGIAGKVLGVIENWFVIVCIPSALDLNISAAQKQYKSVLQMYVTSFEVVES